MTDNKFMVFTRRIFMYGIFSLFILLPVILSIPGKKASYMAKKTGNKTRPVVSGPRRNNKSRASVAVEPCATYHPDTVYRSLVNALSEIGYSPRRGMSVLLKPNIIAQNTPDQATTTHPSLVDAVCRFFNEHSCLISLGDSSAFYQGGSTARGFETTGIASVAKKYGAALIPFETTRLRKITSGRYLNPFYVTEAVFSHDIVVNLPKLKVHRLARYTGGIKNMYGCVVGGSKQVYHRLFQNRPDYQEFWGKPLVDVFEAVEPDLTIMDAVIGLDKDGPAASGEPRVTGLLLASESAPALDIIACRITGIPPDRVPALREAVERGLVSEQAISVQGPLPSVPYVCMPDLVPKKGLMKKIDDYAFDRFIVSPFILGNRCERCDACVEGCATGAICYCCESYCGYGAIRLRGGALNMVMRGARYVLRL
jgi:uncharacterized protein (DUF362 family)